MYFDFPDNKCRSYNRIWKLLALVTYLTPLNGLYFSPNMSNR